MKKLEIEMRIVAGIVERFCVGFITELDQLRETLSKCGVDVSNALPTPFKRKSPINILAFYSIDRRHVMIVFNEGKEDGFQFSAKMGNVEPLGVVGFNSDGDFENVIASLTLQRGSTKLAIDYSFISSYSVFINRLDNLKEFTYDFVRSHIGQYKYHQRSRGKQDYINDLNTIRSQMAKLFFDETINEMVIDKFIEDNPIILEHGLNLIKPTHQAVLKNVLDKYDQDFRPDLIAFDVLEKVWAIVDYKKAKRKIIKNIDKARTGFKAEVHALKDQLRDYVEYFEEKEHRKYYHKTYRENIELTKAIGIIGNIDSCEQVAFNRLVKDEPKWFSVVPYNYLYDSFSRYVDLAKGLFEK